METKKKLNKIKIKINLKSTVDKLLKNKKNIREKIKITLSLTEEIILQAARLDPITFL